ncbi:helix-loop-helix DNA-binding domain-containing protein [Chlamydoabsidia padenii]|nr:helix-loop-helix DNA-binding domain-containing protein [Chlamydoabsidia padenii]
MNVTSYLDDRHYQQLLHDDNDYMIPWFQTTPTHHTPALTHASNSPHDCFTSNELLFSSLPPSSGSFASIYDTGSILIPSDDVPVMNTCPGFILSPPNKQQQHNDQDIDDDEDDDEDDTTHPLTKPFKKDAHNAIERRYRNNINDKIRELQQVVPALCRTHHQHSEEDDDMDDIMEEEDGVPVAKKLNKATILQKSTEYIHYLKYSQQLLKQENDMLQQMVQALPGGGPLLEQFLVDKERFDQAEKERRIKERKWAAQQERINHQRMLKERAAQRAALMSPEERQRRRRRSSQPRKKSSSPPSSTFSPTPSPTSSSSSPSRFLSVLFGISFFAAPTSTGPLVWKQHQSSIVSHTQNASWSDYWPMIRFLLYCFFITYLFILPFLSKIHIRRTSINKKKP